MRRSFLRDEKGAVSTIAVAASAVVLAFAALAVDLGSIFLQTRKLQGIADLAAMAAARDLSNAQRAAEATAAANGWQGPLTVTVTTGGYRADPALAAASRFTPGASSPNAAKVTVAGKADLFFGQAILGRSTTDIQRSATAARAELASFQLGSRLASLNGGVANALLSGLTGSKVTLSVMDYNALAAADVDLLQYVDALGTHLKLEGVSFDKVLATDVSTGDALTVLAKVLDTNGKDTAATAVRALATAAGKATPAELDRIVNLGPYGAQDHRAGASGAGVAVSALDLASTTLQLAQEGRQVKLDLGAGVPGVASTQIWLAIGERPNKSPWMTVASDGSAVIRTAQTRLYIETKVGGGGGLLGSLAQIKLPLLVEAASAEAKLQTLNCGARSAVLAVRPSVGTVRIADIDETRLNDFKTELKADPATLVSNLLLTVTGSAHAKLGGQNWQTVTFSDADIKAGTVKSVSTNDITSALVSSVLGDLDLDVNLLGLLKLTTSDNVIIDAVTAILATVAAPLDAVINTVTSLVGVRVGEADVRVNGLRCREAALVA